MALKALEGFKSRVLHPIKPGDTSIVLRSGDAIKLNQVGVGNHAYFTVEDPVSREVIRYDHTQDWGTGNSREEVPVIRDAGNTGAKNLSMFSCVRHEVSVPFLTDFVTDLINNP